MFAARDMTPVTTYPYDISPNVVLARGVTFSRWGVSSTYGSSALRIETRLGGSFGGPDYAGDAAVARIAKYPGVTFVRAGDRWIATVSDDGGLWSPR
jgi:hypothetical protein